MKFKIRLFLPLLAIFVVVATGAAQELVINGIVRDINTHQEIRGVNIFVKGIRLGTSSNPAGRYTLRIAAANRQSLIVFQHIGYVAREIPLDSAATKRYVDLQPRVIPFREIEITAENPRALEIEKDLPQRVAVIEAKNFEIRGYVDAGDLLRTDQSVQVEEELSGKKTVAIRGGNPNEVVVLYDGVKLNSNFDNVFDLSLIDLEDVERFEIIKGSNTALYGPEAFSGVINIVPKLQRDYHFRFQQRVGTYFSGNWGLHLYQKIKRLQGAYSFKRGGSQRTFVDLPADEAQLANNSLHHTANVTYTFSEEDDSSASNFLSAGYIYTALDYDNQRDVESLFNFNHLLSFKYNGDLAWLKRVVLSTSLRQMEEEQFLASGAGALHRIIAERSAHLGVEKRLQFPRFELLSAYQFQAAGLDFTDERANFPEQPAGLSAAEFQRQHHGLVVIAKYHGDSGADFFRQVNVDVSLRHDRVDDRQNNPVTRGGATSGIFHQNAWRATMFKFSLNVNGYRSGLTFDGYMNFGHNTKFPTLFEQISSPSALTSRAFQPNLNPEKNRSTEIGFVLTRDFLQLYGIYGFQFAGNYFQNYYDNKFRLSSVPGIPVAFYDNVQNARITGLEGKSSVFLLRKKVTLEAGISRYFISEKTAFPFKSDFKRTLSLLLDHAGYSFQLHHFKEGEQVGLVRRTDNSFSEITIPDHTNLDLHLSKTFKLGRFKLFANASGRNLLNTGEVELLGLALRDRRYYFTVSAQY